MFWLFALISIATSGLCHAEKLIPLVEMPKDANYEYIYIPIPKDRLKLTNYGTLSTSGSDFTKIYDVHSLISKKAIGEHLSSSCLTVVLDANRSQDEGSAEEISKFHFDDNQICESAEMINEWSKRVKQYEGNLNLQLKFIGMIFHSIQDFYSHSNYLEQSILDGKVGHEGLGILEVSTLNCKEIKKKYFTSNNNGETKISTARTFPIPPKSHLKDPKSHLHWNKDFHPLKDYGWATIYSRSSLKEYMGKTYFDIIFDTQVKHSLHVFKKLLPSMSKTITCN